MTATPTRVGVLLLHRLKILLDPRSSQEAYTRDDVNTQPQLCSSCISTAWRMLFPGAERRSIEFSFKSYE
jgi:hypothetical protein